MKNKTVILLQFTLILFIVYTSSAKAQNEDAKLKHHIDSLLSKYDTNNQPGIAVSIIKDGKVFFTKGYGMANLEYNIPITSSTVFHIASVSKQFTAFAILLLEEQGKLSLDDDVRKYIPELHDFGKTITLRHLATHTSGLREQQYLLGMSGWRDDDITTDEDVFRLILKQKELNFSPGEKYDYSNTGYTLLAQVISRISNMRFSEFMNQNIFIPLKMKNTQFKDDYEKIIPNRAYAYHKDGSEYKKSIMNNACVGASNLCTTIEDLTLWSINFTNNIVGSPDIFNKMTSVTKLNNGDSINVGLGLYPYNYRGLKEVGSEGFDFGFRAYLSRFPDQNFSVIILTNDGRAIFPFSLIVKIADICLKHQFTEPYKNDDTYTFKTQKDSIDFKYNTEQLKEFSGLYYSEELEINYKIESKNDGLEISQTRIGILEIHPISKDVFQDNGEWDYSKFRFIRNNKNEVFEMRFSGTYGVSNLKFKKIK
jgi:CubicO group peptidase (beta-lactamase class C family)